MHKFATNFKFNLCGLNLLKLEEGKWDLKKGGHSIAPTLRSFKIFHRANSDSPKPLKGKVASIFTQPTSKRLKSQNNFSLVASSR